MVIAIHDINWTLRYWHSVVALSDERLGASGSTDSVLTEERVNELFGAPNRIGRPGDVRRAGVERRGAEGAQIATYRVNDGNSNSITPESRTFCTTYPLAVICSSVSCTSSSGR